MQEKNLKLLERLDSFFKDLDVEKAGASEFLDKMGREVEDLQKEVAILKKHSHPSQEYICCKKCGCEIAKTKIKN